MNVSLRCSNCSANNPAEAHFCGTCGASLSRAVEVSPERGPGGNAIAQAAPSTSARPEQSVTGHCRQCGYANPSTASFCANCGSSLAAAEASSLPRAEAVGPTPATTAPTEGVEYAGFWLRAVAWLLDSVILWLGAVIVSSVLLAGWPSAGYSSTWDGLISPYLLPVAYGVLFVGLRGQTPGKMLLRIRVVNEEGRVPGFWRAALRETLGKLVSALAVGFGFLSVAWNRKKRGWHDIVAGTYVIKV